MRLRRLSHKTPFIVLFIVLAFGLVLFGLGQNGANNSATAITVLPSWSVTIPTAFDFLIASNFSPADGDTEVPLNKSITFSVNKDINTPTASNFRIKPLLSFTYLSAARSYNAATNTATLNPNSDLLPNTLYLVEITDAIQTPGGQTLFNPQTWKFRTIAPPVITSKTPDNGATGVPVDGSVTIVFDKKMNWSTVTAGSFYLQEQGGGTVAATLTKDPDGVTVTLDPSAELKDGKTYVVTVTTAVKAQNGLTLATTAVWSFTTAAGAPQVIARIPPDGATGVPLDQVVSAMFDRDMNPATLTSATFYLQKSGGSPLPAGVTYDAGTRTATLDPIAVLEQGATYEARLTTAVQAATGAPLPSAVVWTFATVGTAPTVTTKVPAAGASNVPVGQVVSATFDKDMDAATLTSATFYIQKSGGSPLPATVAYIAATRTATLDPLADLEAGATYEVTLTTAVRGANGLALAGAPITWTFATAAGAGPGPGIVFSDVAGSPYEAAIYALAAKGAVTGFEDGTYRPNQLVMRQQFAKMIVLTLGLPVTGSETSPFTDVVTQTGVDPFYPSKYVAVCAAQGITVGKTPTSFAPYDTITHQQLITMVVRAAGLTAHPVGYVAPFAAGQFSLDEHYQNALKAGAAGLLNGLVGVGPTYNFLAGSTRGECAQILSNLLTLIGS